MASIPHEKRCIDCGEVKPASEFYHDKTKPTGLGSRCKICHSIESRKRYQANRDKRRAQVRLYEQQVSPEKKARWQEHRNTARRAKRAVNKKPFKSKNITPDGRRCTLCGEVKAPKEFGPRQSAYDGLRSHCNACRRAARAANPEPARETNRRYRETVLRARYLADPKGYRAMRSAQDMRSYWKKPEKYRAIANRRNARVRSNGGSFTAEEWDALCARYDYRCLACGEHKPLHIDHVIPVSKGGTSDITNLQPLCKGCNSRKRDRAIDYRVNNPYEVK